MSIEKAKVTYPILVLFEIGDLLIISWLFFIVLDTFILMWDSIYSLKYYILKEELGTLLLTYLLILSRRLLTPNDESILY